MRLSKNVLFVLAVLNYIVSTAPPIVPLPSAANDNVTHFRLSLSALERCFIFFCYMTEEEKLPFKCSSGNEREKSFSSKYPPPRPIEKLMFENGAEKFLC